MQNAPQTYTGKIMIAVREINFHFSEQYAGEGIEKMKNKKNQNGLMALNSVNYV